jgi:hypothetical protein
MLCTGIVEVFVLLHYLSLLSSAQLLAGSSLPTCAQSCKILIQAEQSCGGVSNSNESTWKCFCTKVWKASEGALTTVCASFCTDPTDNIKVVQWYTSNCGSDSGASEHGGISSNAASEATLNNGDVRTLSPSNKPYITTFPDGEKFTVCDTQGDCRITKTTTSAAPTSNTPTQGSTGTGAGKGITTNDANGATTPSQQDVSSSRMTPGELAGIVVGAVIAAALIGVGAYILGSRRSSTHPGVTRKVSSRLPWPFFKAELDPDGEKTRHELHEGGNKPSSSVHEVSDTDQVHEMPAAHGTSELRGAG